MLEELKAKLSETQKKSITEKLDDLKTELAKEDRKASIVNSKMEELNNKGNKAKNWVSDQL